MTSYIDGTALSTRHKARAHLVASIFVDTIAPSNSLLNPTKAQRDWNLSTYVQALDAAVDVARQITGSPDVTLWGACSGGMKAAAYVGWLAATGQKKVANLISPVCVLDPSKTMDTTMGLMVGEESLFALKAAVKRKGR